jgi:hypothetical protein
MGVCVCVCVRERGHCVKCCDVTERQRESTRVVRVNQIRRNPHLFVSALIFSLFSAFFLFILIEDLLILFDILLISYKASFK